MRRLFLLLLLSCFSWAYAQEVPDSISFEGGLSAKEIEELTTPMHTEGSALQAPIGSALTPLRASSINMGMLPPTERRYVISPNLNIYGMPKGSTLPQWATGYMYGYSSRSFGYKTTAGMGISQQIGEHVRATAGVEFSKYSVYYNTATFNGSVTWSPNRFVDITTFGSYMPGSFFSASALPQLGASFNWGGYIDLHTDTDIPFGIDLGAHTSYDPFFGHETTPIVQPYVKLGGSKIGFDFGPMIRNAIERSNHDSGPGAIPKPIKAVPQVGPRR